MGDVNTKMQAFYNKGRKDAVNDCEHFLRMVAERYGHLQLDNGITMKEFMEIVAAQLSKEFNGQRSAG